jgi:hypothetical protein
MSQGKLGLSREIGLFSATVVVIANMVGTGIWLVKAADQMPYPDPDEADVFSFNSTLTLGIK